MEDVPIGTVIHTLIALDPDVNSSEALNFAATEPITALDKHGNEVLDSEAYNEFFSVDKNTGKVTVASLLQRDVAAVVRIPVLVTDTNGMWHCKAVNNDHFNDLQVRHWYRCINVPWNFMRIFFWT